MQRPHLRLVKNEPSSPPFELVEPSAGKAPWAWLGLVAATVISPLARALDEALGPFEPERPE